MSCPGANGRRRALSRRRGGVFHRRVTSLPGGVPVVWRPGNEAPFTVVRTASMPNASPAALPRTSPLPAGYPDPADELRDAVERCLAPPHDNKTVWTGAAVA